MPFKFFVLSIFLVCVVLFGILLTVAFRWRRRRLGDSPSVSIPEKEESDVLVRLSGVTKTFDHPVLRGIDLEIRQGETLGVLGRSGSGKSVLLKLIVGLLRPDRGAILFDRQDLTQLEESALLKVRKKISYVFQSGAFFDFLDVDENIAYPLREQGIRDESVIRDRVEYLLDAVELNGMGELRYQDLDLGSLKQVAIARAIATDPDAILYDEPTTGVDPTVGKSISRLIRKLNRQENLTSIVVTHDLKCVQIVADRIILLKDGKLHFVGSHEEFQASQDPFVRAFIAGKRFEEEENPARMSREVGLYFQSEGASSDQAPVAGES